MKTTKLITSVLFLFLFLTGCQQAELTDNSLSSKDKKEGITNRTSSGAKKRVLLIGIDGLQLEKIAPANAPNLDSLTIVKGYTGGIAGTSSEQGTKSGPGWMSILTGVWGDKHKVPDNSSGIYKSQAKSVFQFIKEANPGLETASVATWAPIHEFLQSQLSFIDYKYQGGTDDDAVKNALFELQNHNPDFLFVHFDEVDVVGHASGFGTSYDNIIAKTDARLGQITKAIKQRSKVNNEEWLILVTTDHGRSPLGGFSHGEQTEQEKTIFIGMNQVGNEEFNTKINNIPNLDFNGIYNYVAQTSIVPTILSYLGITINKDWQLNSGSLINAAGPRKVMRNAANNGVFWSSASSSTAEVYKNNVLVATVPATQGGFVDTSSSNSKVNYTVLIDGQTGSVLVNNAKVLTSFDWNDALDNVAYFFKTDLEYVKYNKILDKAESGYPRPINNANWNGLEAYKNKIVTAFKWNNPKGFFFLSDGTYLRYDMNADAVDAGYPQPINNSSWPGLQPYATKIKAAVNWGSKVYFFLNDGTYIRYSITSDKVDAGYPQPINNSTWPGLGDYATNIQSAVDWNSSCFYIFLSNNTYIKYNKSTDSAESGYPKPVNNSTWPGLLN